MIHAPVLRRTLLLLATAAATAPLFAQRQTAVFYGAPSGGAFGQSIVAAPDRSGDGPDLLVGMPEWLNGAGRAVWLNGQNGQVLSAAVGAGITTRLGSTLAPAGDLNNDGVQDYVVGAPGADYAGIDSGHVAAISGATGAVLWTRNGAAGHRWGESVVSVGDLTGDGRHEIAVGAPRVDVGQVSILNGANGSTLRSFSGDPFTRFGTSIALLQPLGTGPVRLLVSEPMLAGTAGRVWLINPSQPPAASAVWQNSGAPGEQIAERLSALGDVNGDGTPDFLASRSNHRVDVRSGTNGTVLHTFSGAAADDFGYAFAGAGDLDRDGVPDLAIGAPGTNIQNGAATVYSGATFAPLFSLPGSPGARFGEALAAVGDLDGDQWPELAIGAPFHFQPGLGGVGRVTTYSVTVQPTATAFGSSCAGSLAQAPVLNTAAAPRLGQSTDLKILQAPANTVVVFAQGLSASQAGALALPFDLGGLGAPGCALRTSLEATAAAVTNSSGAAVLIYSVPTTPSLAGFRWFAQGAVLTPANALGLLTTNGLDLRVGHP
jgi:FG-GAP repeat